MKKRKKKYKSVITRRIYRATERLALAVLALLFLLGVVQIGGTNAGFSDIEESTGNTFSAASLDGRPTLVTRFSVTGMTPVDQLSQTMKFANVGVLNFRYGIKFLKTGGDEVLCNAFILTAKRNGVSVYTGLLKDFIDINQSSAPVVPFEIARFGLDNWNFTVELPADADGTLEHKSCQWDFDFTAWQTDMPDATQGFSDGESVGTHSIATGEWLTPGDVVINEVMWMGSTVSPLDKWIELKNMTGEGILLEGWKIENAGPSNGTITLPAGAFIPAHGYYLIANYDNINVLSALNADVDYDVLNLSLNDTGNGNLVLKTNTALVIDSALGTPNWPAGCNDKSGVCAGLRQSMERKDNPVPGDGLLDASWHPCISEDAKRLPYWDAIGNNYGTPKAPNLSPVVMNEIMFNPSDGDKEWVELFNISGEDIDVSGWYFENSNGDKIVISKENSDNNKNLDDEGETNVLAGGRLVVYFAEGYFSNEKDEVSLYNDMGTPDDEKDDVREDAYKYEDSTKKAGDSIMRIPDGVGIWIDPEATPGEENKLGQKETADFQLMAYDKCFVGEKIKKKSQDEICAPAFLKYLGMIKELDDQKIKGSTLLGILEIKLAEEAKKLAVLLAETAAMTAGKLPVTDAPAEGSGNAETAENPTAAGETPPAVEEEAAPAEEVIIYPEPTPVEPVTPEAFEELAAPEEEVTVPAEKPPVEKVEEAPVDAPKETPIIETPAN